MVTDKNHTCPRHSPRVSRQRTKSRRLLRELAPDPSPNQGVMTQQGTKQDVMSPLGFSFCATVMDSSSWDEMNDYWLDSAVAAVADASLDEDGFLEDERKEGNIEDLVRLRELGTDFLEGELVYDESSMRELNLDKFEWLDAANNDAPLNNDSLFRRMDYSAVSFML